MNRCLTTICVVVLAASAAWGQRKEVPPPPKPPDSGPSLEATMKFIQDKLNEVTDVAWVTTLSDVVARNTGAPEKMRQTVRRVSVSSSGCRLSFFRQVSNDGHSLRHIWWTYSYSPPGQQRRDWVQAGANDWYEINEDGSRSHFQVLQTQVVVDGVRGTVAGKDDASLKAFIPDRGQTGTYGRWLRMQFPGQGDWKNLGRFVEDTRESEANVEIDLRSVQTLEVLPFDQMANARWAEEGFPETKESMNDPVPFVVVAVLPRGKREFVLFPEREISERVAKAMVHAVELCGGGQKDEPF